ncbi:cell division protein ZapA [Anaeromicropila populeti]|uniref:Cell division protein ZapA n=2 Tax=Anaeromicropila populeti TaxID=37658 RepID=A0A1I6K6P2_9FIRM|nr:cell division protein ZapA [Anaeromicropila populeti]
MYTKNDVEVLINNKKLIICGYESAEYLQRIASYINNKIVDFKNIEGYKSLDSDMRNTMMQINIADDLFKVKEQLEEIQQESDRKSSEIYNMKHDLVAARTKLEEKEVEMLQLREEYNELQKRIIQLETERKERRVLDRD